MDDIAYRLNMDPLEFRLKNMTRKFRDQVPYTSYGLEDCLRKGAEAFEWKKRWHAPGADAGPIKKGVGHGHGHVRVPRLAAALRSSKWIRRASIICSSGVTDIGSGAKTTMGLIAAEELGVPLEKVMVVNGDTATCPFSVGRIRQPDDGANGHGGWWKQRAI